MPNFETPKVPDNFQTATEDVVGYWDSDVCPIYCIPRAAKIFDGNIDKSKPSTLILVELTKPCQAHFKKQEGEDKPTFFEAKKGDMVGVWGKPGMKAIRDLCNVDIIMWEKNETLKTGKPNPMKLFEIKFPTGAKKARIPVIEDKRDKSASVETMLAGPRPVSKVRPQQPVDSGLPTGDEDDIPF